jgi:hypothetical protein
MPANFSVSPKQSLLFDTSSTSSIIPLTVKMNNGFSINENNSDYQIGSSQSLEDGGITKNFAISGATGSNITLPLYM